MPGSEEKVMREDVERKGYSTVSWGIYGGQDCPDTIGIIHLGKKSDFLDFEEKVQCYLLRGVLGSVRNGHAFVKGNLKANRFHQ